MLDFETTSPWIDGLIIVAILALVSPFLLRMYRRRAALRREENILRMRRREVEIWNALQSERAADAQGEAPSKADAEPPAL